MPSAQPLKWRHFQADIILLNVRCYLRYSLNYRDLEEMMQEGKGRHLRLPELLAKPHFCNRAKPPVGKSFVAF